MTYSPSGRSRITNTGWAAPLTPPNIFNDWFPEWGGTTFESTVNWRLLARDGSELASGFTMGGGVDGADRFSFTVTYTHSTAGEVGSLEVFEVDASGGEGAPPPRVVLPLVLP